MIGTIVNTCTIATGAVVGSILKKGIKPQYQDSLFNAMGFAATALGVNAVVSHMPDSQYTVLFIVSLAIGSLLGSVTDLDANSRSLYRNMHRSDLDRDFQVHVFYIVSVRCRSSDR